MHKKKEKNNYHILPKCIKEIDKLAFSSILCRWASNFAQRLNIEPQLNIIRTKSLIGLINSLKLIQRKRKKRIKRKNNQFVHKTKQPHRC